MCMLVCVYVCVHVCVCVCVCVCACMCVRLGLSMLVCLSCVYVCVCVRACVRMCVRVRLRACVCACVLTCSHLDVAGQGADPPLAAPRGQEDSDDGQQGAHRQQGTAPRTQHRARLGNTHTSHTSTTGRGEGRTGCVRQGMQMGAPQWGFHAHTHTHTLVTGHRKCSLLALPESSLTKKHIGILKQIHRRIPGSEISQ